MGCSPQGHKESDTTERLHFHFSLSCTGEGNGNPLQRSCLENPRDGGAWWAAVYGVAQSRTRLKWLSSSSSSNLFFLANLVLMSSQDVRYKKGSGQNSRRLDIFLNLFSAAGWEVYKAPLKLVRQVLSCPFPVPLAGHFLYPFYFNKFYTKLWVTETVFGPRVKSSHLETMNPVTLFIISYHEQLSTRSHMQLVSLLLVSLSLKLIYLCLPGQFSE